MKTTILLLLLITIMITGCSSGQHLSDKRITVIGPDSSKKDYGLLSVRGDSTLVVLDYAESKIEPIPFAHAVVLKMDSLKSIVYHNGSHAGTGAAIGLIGGLVVGGLASGSSHFSHDNSYSVQELPSSSPKLVNSNGAVLAAAIIGVCAGELIGSSYPDDRECVLYSRKLRTSSGWDFDYLRSISFYPLAEPPELQDVK